MSKKATVDFTTTKCLGFCGFGLASNAADIDVKDGRVVRVRPVHYDENYTREDLKMWSLKKDDHVFDPGFKTLLPPFSLTYKTRAYSPNRIPYPMKRVDWDPHGERNPQNRGISGYERISWDEATQIVASEIKRMHDEYSPFSIYCQGEGHGEPKNYGGSHGVQIEMLRECGGSTIQSRNADSWEGWYWGAKWIWGMDPVGQNVYQNGVFKDITENGDAVLFWGADPETTPWGWGGQLPSRMCYWFNEIGVKSIFICPDVNYTSAVHADKWIPVLPNTDAALQLAIAYVWMTEDLYDKAYIETHADGFDWFEAYVLGRLDGVAKTPAWAAGKCGVRAATIKALARYWAKSAVSIAHCNGGGYIRSAFSHEPARLEVALLGMQSLGKPGANQFQFIEWTLFGLPTKSPVPRSEIYPSTEGTYHGFSMVMDPSFIPKTLLPKAIMDGKAEWYGHTAAGYPKEDQLQKFVFPITDDTPGLHMIWSDAPCWSTCWNGGFEMEEALRSSEIETIVVQHPWLENDCLFADILLPTSTTFEVPDLSGDNYNGQAGMIFVEEQCIEPVGEAICDYEVVCEVAKKLEQYGGQFENLYEKYNKGLDAEGWMRKGFEESGIADRITFEQLREQRFWCSPVKDGWEDEPAGMIAFHNDPKNNPLGTPNGKITYYSTVLAEYFPEDQVRAPYPQWIEETPEHQDRISSERAQKYPFPLMSNHPRWRVHANCDDIPWIREIETCKVVGPDGYGYEPVWINPLDADRLGIADGDIVKLFNERGEVLGGAYVTERIRPGVLYQDHGARIDAIRGGRKGLDRGGANNLICTSEVTSQNCAGEVTNSFLVGIEKVDVLELAKQYPAEFGRAYDPATGLIPDSRIVEGA